MTEATTAARFSDLMEVIWEGGPAYGLSFQHGKTQDACAMLQALFPSEWATKQDHLTGEDEPDRYSVIFADGSRVIVDIDGNGLTEDLTVA